jgi:hypothetical protein
MVEGEGRAANKRHTSLEDALSITQLPTSDFVHRDPRLVTPSRLPISLLVRGHCDQVFARQPAARHDECIQQRRPEVRLPPHPCAARVRRPGISGRYIQELTKALSGEVRVLPNEVGALQDERCWLHQRVAESPILFTCVIRKFVVLWTYDDEP